MLNVAHYQDTYLTGTLGVWVAWWDVRWHVGWHHRFLWPSNMPPPPPGRLAPPPPTTFAEDFRPMRATQIGETPRGGARIAHDGTRGRVSALSKRLSNARTIDLAVIQPTSNLEHARCDHSTTHGSSCLAVAREPPGRRVPRRGRRRGHVRHLLCRGAPRRAARLHVTPAPFEHTSHRLPLPHAQRVSPCAG